MTPQSILYVITTLDVGGAEKHLLWLVEGMRRRGSAVDVVYLKGGGRLTPEFEKLGARVSRVSFERPTDLVSAVLALRRRIKSGHYDLVHTHLLKADALGAVACRLAGQRALVASKHNEEPALRRRLVGVIHGILSRAARRVIALSDYVLEYVHRRGRVARERLVRVYYGIDASRFAGGDRDGTRAKLGLAPSTNVALCVARFHPQKDHATLFRALKRVRDGGSDVVLLLAGDDPFYGHRKTLEDAVAALGIGGSVRFLGIRDDVKDLLAACDVFALPSLYEGLGLVYLEAMAAGRPVLATRNSAIPEVVADGTTGFLVTTGDDAALADCWSRLIEDPALGRRLGAAGRERVVERFALDRMLAETDAVYRDAIGS